MMIALFETGAMFAAVTFVLAVWVQPPVLDWTDAVWLLMQAAALSLCCTVAFYYNELYDLRVVRDFREFTSRLLQAFGVAFVLLAGFYTIFPDTRLARGPFISSFIVLIGLLLPFRALSYAIIRSRPFEERVLILGNGALARKLIHEIDSARPVGRRIVGIVDEGSGASYGPYPPLGSLEELPQIVASVRPHRIVVALSERRGRLPVGQLLDARMQGIAIEDGVDLYERLTGKLAIESLTPSSLIFSKDFKKSRLELAGGRLVSVVVSGVGLVVLAPLLVAIAAAIKLDSRGSIFFLQERIGKDGRPFKLIKFRTMRPLDGTSSEWVRDNSHRITRVGRYLRQFRLDELPQFVNILRGDLNLVGPRPHPVSNFELFLREIPYYSVRAVVHPGVTGWAQVRYGYANNLEEETEKMRYDLYFIKHLSLWLDLVILVDTVKTVFFGRGAMTTVKGTLTPHGAPTR